MYIVQCSLYIVINFNISKSLEIVVEIENLWLVGQKYKTKDIK